MSEISLNQSQGMETFLVKMSEGSVSINQLLAFMSLSNTMTALNLLNGSEQKNSASSTVDTLLKGGDAQGLQSAIGNMLGQGGNKLNLADLMGMLGNTMGQQGQGKLNPQMLLSLLSMFSQMENKKKPAPVEEKEELIEEEKVKEHSKEKNNDKK